jgi:uncharacterized protein (DUF1697 family)
MAAGELSALRCWSAGRGRGGVSAFLALIRGINVGGHKMIAMADLRDLLTKLGFDDARSVLQSGNLIFQARTRTTTQLESLLEKETEKRLGLETTFFIRTPAEWKTMIAQNPFRKEAERDPGHLLVLFLKDARDETRVEALRAAIVGREVVQAIGKHAYVVYPDGVGRSRLTNALIEKKLGTRATGRNWNTVLKLGALAE